MSIHPTQHEPVLLTLPSSPGSRGRVSRYLGPYRQILLPLEPCEHTTLLGFLYLLFFYCHGCRRQIRQLVKSPPSQHRIAPHCFLIQSPYFSLANMRPPRLAACYAKSESIYHLTRNHPDPPHGRWRARMAPKYCLPTSRCTGLSVQGGR